MIYTARGAYLATILFIAVCPNSYSATTSTDGLQNSTTIQESLGKVAFFLNLPKERLPGLVADRVTAAIMAHDLKAVKVAVTGSNVEVATPVAITPLGFACLVNAPQVMIDYLISIGGKINARSGFSNTPFLYASAFGSVGQLEHLTEIGAKAKVYNSRDETPLLLAAKFNKDPDVLGYLVGLGFNINSTYDFGHTALMICAQYNQNPGVLERLISLGADIHLQEAHGLNALDIAAAVPWIWLTPGNRYWPNSLNCKILLQAGIDSEDSRKSHSIALSVASANADISVLHLLFDFGGSVDLLRQQKRSPILVAATSNPNTEAIQLLLNRGCDVNDEGKENDWTAIFYAIKRQRNPEIIMYLIDKGADLSRVDSSGQTPWDYFSLEKIQLPDEYKERLRSRK